MSFFDRPLRDRPFKRMVLGRRIRRVAQVKLRQKQLTQDQYEQVCAKTQDLESLKQICDHIENDDEELYGAIDWQGWWEWLVSNWPSILRFIFTIAPLLLDEPPKRGGFVPNVGVDMVDAKRKRLAIKSYQDDEDFQADKEATLDELNARSD